MIVMTNSSQVAKDDEPLAEASKTDDVKLKDAAATKPTEKDSKPAASTKKKTKRGGKKGGSHK